MKSIRLTFFSSVFIALSVLFSCGSGSEDSDQIVHDTLAVITTKVQQCSRLYGAEYRVRKIITHNEAVKFHGSIFNQHFSVQLPFSSRKIAIPIDATFKGGIDFSKFSADNVRRYGEQIEIILPDPEIVLTSSRIDHVKVRQYAALLRSKYSDEELTRFTRQGRKSILEDVSKTDIVERTRHSAAKLLIPMLMQMGFEQKNIIVTYRKDFNPAKVEILTPSVQAGR